MRNNHLLVTPLGFEEKPECVFFIKEVSRQSELIDVSKIL
jgi:hypothetical protein